MEPTNQSSSPAIPIAIISGFAMIALAIFFTNQGSAPAPAPTFTAESQENTGEPRPVTAADYIRGNPNAPILMVEYSDYDCPFCKQYHATMNQIMDEFGVTGQVAWVYRQFPLAPLHPNAPKIAEAALCVGDIGDNTAFWEFSDLIFEKRAIDAPTNVTQLDEYAQAVGIQLQDYIDCMESGRMQDAVTADIESGFNAGARGTPYTVIMVGNEEAVINGAQPYETVKPIVQNLIDQLKGLPPTPATTDDAEATEEVAPVLQ